MTLDRRTVLKGGAALSAFAASPAIVRGGPAFAANEFAPKPGAWRTYEITTAIEILKPEGVTQAWVPVPALTQESWIKAGETTWSTPTGKAERVRDAKSGAEMIHIAWPTGDAKPEAAIVSRFQARDRFVAPEKAAGAPILTGELRKRYTAATELLPLDGIVAETAQKITAGATSGIDKAKRIYDWVVDNTYRNPKTRGCGTGDIASMLKTGTLNGKCADLNALYVGLARASGLPARDIYGIRVSPSSFGYKALGANAAIITKAQHCRAEVFLDGIGWFPVDPADVRKVVLEEPPANLALDDPKVLAVRAALFGSWETNWLGFNDAHDVKLPGTDGPTIPFLMYPQGETKQGRLDSLDPDNFKYVITAREIIG